jgi:glycosyltransferase involved in cell wall biosynthesis
MNTQKLFEKFNTDETALIISGYPEKTSKGKNHGIAWYTKKTIEPIAKKYGQKFIVLAEKNHHNEPTTYMHGKILVLRIFDHKKIHLYPQILTWLVKFSKIKHVYVHSEFGMSGGIWHFGLLIPFLFLIRLAGKKVTFFSHNVIDNVEALSGHLNIAPHSLTAHVLNLGLRVYYWALAMMCMNIVVLDETLALRLAKFAPQEKILTLPIPVDKKSPQISQRKAKENLNIPATDKVILFFGFVTWYKGADWLIKTFDRLVKNKQIRNTHLIIAGGPSYSLASKPYYQAYYNELLSLTQSNRNIRITGFVPEKEIGQYYAAADMVVLPYRGLMGASGCLSHALSYEKPIMLSTLMGSALHNPEVKSILADLKMNTKDITFGLNTVALKRMIKMLKKPSEMGQLKKFSTELAAARNTERLLNKEYNSLYAELSATAEQSSLLAPATVK